MVHDCEAKWCWKSLAEFLVNIFIFYFTALNLYFHYPINLPTRSMILQIYFSTSKLLIFRRDLLFECFSFCLHLLLELLSVFCQQLPTLLECLSLSFCSRNRCLKLIKFLCKFALLFFILFPTTLFLHWFWKNLWSASLRFCFRYFLFGIWVECTLFLSYYSFYAVFLSCLAENLWTGLLIFGLCFNCNTKALFYSSSDIS